MENKNDKSVDKVWHGEYNQLKKDINKNFKTKNNNMPVDVYPILEFKNKLTNRSLNFILIQRSYYVRI